MERLFLHLKGMKTQQETYAARKNKEIKLLPYSPSKPSPQKPAVGNTQKQSKNETVMFLLNGGQRKNQTKQVINFIRSTMQILSKYKNQFEGLVIRFDSNGNIINIFKHSLSTGHYDLLNKNSNFCSISGQDRNDLKVSIRRLS